MSDNTEVLSAIKGISESVNSIKSDAATRDAQIKTALDTLSSDQATFETQMTAVKAAQVEVQAEMDKFALQRAGVKGDEDHGVFDPQVRKDFQAAVKNKSRFSGRLKAAGKLLQMMAKAALNPALQGVTAGAFAGNYDSGTYSPARNLTTNVRDLLSSVDYSGTDGTGGMFTRENVVANNAATVAPLAAKPYSDLEYTKHVANFQTIAHMHDVANQVFKTSPQTVDRAILRLVQMLNEKVDWYLLNGADVDGIGGLITQAGAALAITVELTPVAPADLTLLDAILQAIYSLPAGYMPDAIVMNRVEHQKLVSAKDLNGNYLFPGALAGGLQVGPWGLAVVVSDHIVSGTMLIGAFGFGAELWERGGVEIAIADQNKDNFEKNITTVRAETYLALAVFRTDAFKRIAITYA